MQPDPHAIQTHLAAFMRANNEPPLHKDDWPEIILEAAASAMAKFGVHAITLTRLARGTGIPRGAIVRSFSHMQGILAQIMCRHLMRIQHCISLIPEETPNRQALIRAIYLRATRTRDGALNDAHRLLVRDFDLLPPVLTIEIIEFRDEIAANLAEPHARAIALRLLDSPEITQAEIEPLIAAIPAPRQTVAEPIPAPRPAQPHGQSAHAAQPRPTPAPSATVMPQAPTPTIHQPQRAGPLPLAA